MIESQSGARDNNVPVVQSGLFAAGLSMALNFALALLKIVVGLVGNSYALVADGIESSADIFSSLIVWGGLKVSMRPPDADHPYGHGKAEALAAIAVSLMLLAAAVLIAIQSIKEIRTPHYAPAWYTLAVLLVVVLVKESLFRYSARVGKRLRSSALRSDAWHHRSDALTSAAAFIGISVALIGGPGFESADDWAALVAASIIVWNGVRLLRAAADEIMDVSAGEDVTRDVEAAALQVNGVLSVEKCRIRKVGLHLAMDIHIRVEGNLSVREGHEIAHRVKDRIIAMEHRIRDVTIHVEPG